MRPLALLSGRLPYIGLIVAFCFAAVVFFAGLEVFGIGLRGYGSGVAERLIELAGQPLVGLCVGVLATSLLQSSSLTTSLVVAVVASGGLTLPTAVPVIMGANIGTSVTNTLVAFGHVVRRTEFERAIAGATVHDAFNLVATAILLPLELATGLLSSAARAGARLLVDAGGAEWFNPLQLFTAPLTRAATDLIGDQPAMVILLGVVAVVVALRLLVRLLRAALLRGGEEVFNRTVFARPAVAVALGAVLTAIVQSSSLMTSILVPLAGAGVLPLRQVYALTIGANLGTTATALVAALSIAAGAEAAWPIEAALVHVIYNVFGATMLLTIPRLRDVPLHIARWLGTASGRNRLWALAYVSLLFFVIPLAVIGARLLSRL